MELRPMELKDWQLTKLGEDMENHLVIGCTE